MKWMKRQQLAGYLFVLPSIIGVTVFFDSTVILLRAGFHQLAGPTGRDLRFVGLTNFRRLLFDGIFWKAVRNNVFYLLHVPLSVGVGFLVASGLNRRVFFAMDSEQFLLTLLDQRSRHWILLDATVPSYPGPINQLLVSLGVEIPRYGWPQPSMLCQRLLSLPHGRAWVLT